MSKTITLVLSVACAAFAAGSLYLFSQLGAQSERAASEAAGRLQAEARVRELQASVEKLENLKIDHEPGRMSTRVDALRSATTSSNYSTALDGPPGSGQQFGRFGRMDRGGMPGMQNMNKDLIKALNLSDSDAAKLLKIFADRQAKFRQLAEQSRGGPPDPQTMESLQQEMDKQIQQLLGEQKFQEYQDYRKDAQEHARVSQLAQRLTDAGQTALSQAQQDQLFGVMKSEKTTVAPPVSANFATRSDFSAAMTDWRAAYDQRVRDRVVGILTPEQFDAFKNIRRPSR